jgi:hypothetical protein
MRKLFAFIPAVSLASICFSQKPEEVFSWHSENLPPQHIYVQFDKQAYVAGDTAWFKAYLYSNYAPSTISTNFFIDLLDEKGGVIMSKRYPIFDGTAFGNFDLPANLKQAVYITRAYTKWEINLGAPFIFKKALPIFNPSNSSRINKENKVILEFFPESGVIVSGLPNNIAFKITNDRYQPVPANADIIDGKGNKIGNFAKAQSEGIFSFTPVSKEKYVASVSFPDGRSAKYELPTPVEKGIVLTVADEENGKSFSAIGSAGLLKNGDQLQLVAVIENHVVLDVKVPVNNNEALGLISTKNLHPGVMHIFLFDGQNKLLAERTTIVQNQKLSLPVELKIDELGRATKSKNIFSFSFPETVTGSFSVSVTDADKELLPTANEDIYSTILTESGSSKYFSQPNYANEDEVDVLAISNRWYGDNWQMLAKKNQPLHLKDKYISVTGKTTTEDGDATVIEGNMNIIVQPKNFMQKNYTIDLGTKGNFNLDSLIFEDSARIYYELISTKKNKKGPEVKLIVNEPKDDLSSMLSGIDYSLSKAKEPVLEDNKTLQLAADLQKNLLAASQTQAQIKPVKKDKQADKKDVDKRYAGGMFGSSNSKTFDFINDPPAHGGINVFESLQGQVGGLIIERVNTGYNLWSSRSVSTNEVLRGNRRGLVPGKVYLNEQESSSDVVMRIPIEQIALVKYYEPGSIMLPGTGLSPILAFWTKRQEDMDNAIKNDMAYVMQNGYSPTRKFYSPDYSVTSKNISDNRTTLYWDPNISVNDNKQFTISFYNSDSAKRFHVVVEGFTSDGKLVHFDKVIEVVKGF